MTIKLTVELILIHALASARITRTKHAHNDLSLKRVSSESLLYPSNAANLCGDCNARLCRSVVSNIVLQSGTPSWKWLEHPKDLLGETETNACGIVHSCSILMDLLCRCVTICDSYSLSWNPMSFLLLYLGLLLRERRKLMLIQSSTLLRWLKVQMN